jgi:hypothetical protein
MMGHNVKCDLCPNLANGEEDGYDMPCPDDRLCRTCRKAVKDAREQVLRKKD